MIARSEKNAMIEGIGLVYKKPEHRVREIRESYMDFLSKDDKKKIFAARYMAEKKADDEWIEEHRKGYCPTCFCLRMKSGKCPNGCDD